MTIRENIVLVPKLLKVPVTAIPMNFLADNNKESALCGLLAANQDIILMDEPFGALDPITRDSLQDLVKDLQERLEKLLSLLPMIWMKR